jgi:hypothetical protein
MNTEHKQVLVKHDLISLEVDEGIAPLFERLLKLNIKTLNSCEDNVPSGWMWVEFLSAYQAERFLNIIAKYSGETKSLYNRIRQGWSLDDGKNNWDENNFWKYSAHPNDYGIESTVEDDCVIETFTGSHLLRLSISIRFPRTDLPEVLENLDSYINEFKKDEPKIEKENTSINKPIHGTWQELKGLLKND